MVEYTSAELVAQHALDYLINRCAEELYENYLDAKVIPFSLEMLLGILCGGLESEFIRVDTGDIRPFQPDPELVPNPTDSWARAHISVRKVIRASVAEAELPPISMDTKSLKSSESYSQRSLLRKTTNSLMPSLKALERPKPYILESAMELPEPELDALRANKEREIQQRKADSEKERVWRQQREEEARRLDRMASDLRNSNFTYDYDGKIVITKPRPLPSPNYVQYEVSKIPAQTTLSKMKSSTSPKRASALAKNPVQLAKKVPVSELQFVKVMNTTPNIMELLKVGTGVTAFESNYAKRGPDLKLSTMTREEYRTLTATVDDGQQTDSHAHKPLSKHAKSQKSVLMKKALSDIPDSDREEEVLASASLPALLPNENLSAIDKFNLQILHSPDWGMNTGKGSLMPVGPLPTKPTARAERATHGIKLKKPRDRPFVDRKSVHERLPQPPLGKTMGHGLLE